MSTILTRQARASKLNESTLLTNIKSKNLTEPLCGLSSYTGGDIPVGTVVGIQLESPEVVTTKLAVTQVCKLKDGVKFTHFRDDSDANSVYCEERSFQYKRIYEHFFKITQHNSSNDSYTIEPVGDKVIFKGVKEHFTIIMPFEPEFYFNRSSVVESHSEFLKSTGKPHLNLEGFRFSDQQASILNSLLEETATTGTNAFVKCQVLPFQGSYKNVLLVGSEDLPQMESFYAALQDHHQFFESVLTCSEIEDLGSIGKIQANFDLVYNEIIASGNGMSSISLSYDVDIPDTLIKSPLNVSELKTVKRNEIFRVLLDDPIHFVNRAAFLMDSDYKDLSPAILDHLTPGNLVCIVVTSLDAPGFMTKEFVRILDRLNDNEFLVSHYNVYGYRDEDFVLVIDARSIIEIPTSWPANNNLKGSDGNVMDDPVNNEPFPMSYSSLLNKF